MARPLALIGAAAALLAAAAGLVAATEGASAEGPLEIGRFTPSAMVAGLPEGWETLAFKKVPRQTRYSVVRDGEGWVLRAESQAAASGLYRPLDLDPRSYPILSWRWKVDNVLRRADARRKEGDDFAARVYVAFRYDPATATLWEKTTYGAYRALYGRYPPRGALSYVWDNRLALGTTLDNAYTPRTKMIVLRSGEAQVGQWVSERRDLVNDYRRLFGADPPRIAGLAVMTDTDDTGESAVAYYDAITLATAD